MMAEPELLAGAALLRPRTPLATFDVDNTAARSPASRELRELAFEHSARPRHDKQE